MIRALRPILNRNSAEVGVQLLESHVKRGELLGRDLAELSEACAKQCFFTPHDVSEGLIVPNDKLAGVGNDNGLIDAVDNLSHNTVQRGIARSAAFFLPMVIAVDKKGDSGGNDINKETHRAYYISTQRACDTDGGKEGKQNDAAQNADPRGDRQYP